jgi:hypothetical protein
MRYGHPSLQLTLGGLVHGEVAQRSRHLFSLQHESNNSTESAEYRSRIARWLQKYDGSIVAGSYMPDWYLELHNTNLGDINVPAQMISLK